MSEPARILVVDDEESIRKPLVAILEEEGYIVDTAENGKEAIEKSETKFYNLALIDIRLLDMEGTKLLTSIKETTPKMVKIIVTGYPALQNAIEAVNKGADGYILKPVNMDSLLKTIKEHLKKQQEAKKYSEQSNRIHRNTSQRIRINNQQKSIAQIYPYFILKRFNYEFFIVFFFKTNFSISCLPKITALNFSKKI
jgi:DNA-binding NtrC family response regulator